MVDKRPTSSGAWMEPTLGASKKNIKKKWDFNYQIWGLKKKIKKINPPSSNLGPDDLLNKNMDISFFQCDSGWKKKTLPETNCLNPGRSSVYDRPFSNVTGPVAL